MKKTIAASITTGVVIAGAFAPVAYRINKNTENSKTAAQDAYAVCLGSNEARRDVDRKFDKLALLIQAQAARRKDLTADQRRYTNDLLRALREPVHRSVCKR